MTGPVAQMLPNGARLHLQHGPIDLIIGADGPPAAVRAAYAAAARRFEPLLAELVAELPALRAPCPPTGATVDGAVARRMATAVRPHAGTRFVTPMATVAGAVADEVLGAMTSAATLERAYVNNGGDIALHLADGRRFDLAIASLDGAGEHGRVRIDAKDPIRGVATSGRGGRSLSLGIADSVTVLARTAAAADAAATLIANAVDLPGHPAIERRPARDVDPDSDLGERLVAVACGKLSPAEVEAALACGAAAAGEMREAGLIERLRFLRRDNIWRPIPFVPPSRAILARHNTGFPLAPSQSVCHASADELPRAHRAIRPSGLGGSAAAVALRTAHPAGCESPGNRIPGAEGRPPRPPRASGAPDTSRGTAGRRRPRRGSRRRGRSQRRSGPGPAASAAAIPPRPRRRRRGR